MDAYFLGNQPAGSNNANAFLAGLTTQYLFGAGASTLPRRAVTAYSNLTSTGSFNARLTAPGVISSGARIGPQMAFFPFRHGKTTNTITSPY
jgi:hypothetical protein